MAGGPNICWLVRSGRYAEIGVSHIQFYPDPCTVEGIEKLAPVLEILDQG